MAAFATELPKIDEPGLENLEQVLMSGSLQLQLHRPGIRQAIARWPGVARVEQVLVSTGDPCPAG